MIDKWMYKFCGILDKLSEWLDNILFRKNKKKMSFKMDYRFTAILIILLCLMALFLEPGYIPK